MTLVLLFGVAAASYVEAQSRVRVRGYFRKDGTYVRPHYRTAPDGIPYNNYSFPGNYNPNTGRTTAGDPFTYLREYYQDRDGVSLPRGSNIDWAGFDRELEKMKILPDVVIGEELERSYAYCGRLYVAETPGAARCFAQQFGLLSSIILPDYSTLPGPDLGRSGAYCERLYGDDRGGFYNCLNRQLLGISRPEADMSHADSVDAARSTRYCERVYGDDRAGFRSCLERQSRGLRDTRIADGGLPKDDWDRSVRYCERIYGDDRAGNQGCLNRQHRGIAAGRGVWDRIPDTESWRVLRYCERLYGDDRAGAFACEARQAFELNSVFASGDGDQAIPSSVTSYCSRQYGDDRAGYWGCIQRRLPEGGIGP